VNKDELYAQPGWEACTFEGARRQVLAIGLETTFREKIEWLQEAEEVSMWLRGRKTGSKTSSSPHTAIDRPSQS
jgi:hypothetical protein